MTHRATLLGIGLAVVCCCSLAAHWYWPRGEDKSVTFSRDVAPIIFSKCSTCHHPGESAPFSLLTAEDVRRRGRQIVDVTQKRFMPPWLPSNSHFAGDRRLSDRELDVLRQWVENGTPDGDETVNPPVFADGWQAGPPDLILESPDYTLAGADRDVFRNFVVPVPLTTPRWVESIELRPTNPRATHHARLGVDTTGESVRRDAADAEAGYAGMAWGQDPDGQLVIWAPGMVAHPGTPGVAWRLQPKTSLVLHAHLQPTGKPETVKFRIGIRFAKEPPTQFPAMLRIGSCDIDIPAGAASHTVTDQYALPVDVDVHTIFPHAHSLCKTVSVVAERPDGSREQLLTIAEFDENWHESYRFREPLRLPRGTKLVSTFTYDNSAANIRNRHRPPRRVIHGSNADDEMADICLQVTPVHADQRAALMEHYQRYELQSQAVGYRKSLELNPANPWSQDGLAACHVGLGQPALAIPLLEQRLKVKAEVFPMVSLGMALAASGDPARAEARFRQALAVDGEDSLAWLGLAKALIAQRKPEPAEPALLRAVELSPNLLEARVMLADLLMRRGQLEQAASVCTAALAYDNAGIYLKLAEISARKREYSASLDHCRHAQRLAPYTHPPKVLLAVFCFSNGDPARGLTLLREARAESPQHPMPPLMLAQLARQQKEIVTAKDLIAATAALPIPDNWPESHQQRFLALLQSERSALNQ